MKISELHTSLLQSEQSWAWKFVWKCLCWKHCHLKKPCVKSWGGHKSLRLVNGFALLRQWLRELWFVLFESRFNVKALRIFLSEVFQRSLSVRLVYFTKHHLEERFSLLFESHFIVKVLRIFHSKIFYRNLSVQLVSTTKTHLEERLSL